MVEAAVAEERAERLADAAPELDREGGRRGVDGERDVLLIEGGIAEALVDDRDRLLDAWVADAAVAQRVAHAGREALDALARIAAAGEIALHQCRHSSAGMTVEHAETAQQDGVALRFGQGACRR